MTPTELRDNEAALIEALNDAEAIFVTVAREWEDRGIYALKKRLHEMREWRSHIEMLVLGREQMQSESSR